MPSPPIPLPHPDLCHDGFMTALTPQQLRRLQRSLGAFISAFDRMMEVHVEADAFAPGQGYLPTAWASENADPAEVRRRVHELSRLAGECEGASSVGGILMKVQGVGVVDPITNWSLVLQPKAFLRPSEIRRMAIQAQGRISALIAAAEEDAPDLPSLGPASLHPLIWDAAAPLWTMHQLRRAVQAGADALMDQIAEFGQRRDMQEKSRWEQLFSTNPPEVGRPRLRWPGDPNDLTVKSVQQGLIQLGAGLQMVVRNPATHARERLTEQEAFEQLAALSMMARFMDACELLEAPPPAPKEA